MLLQLPDWSTLRVDNMSHQTVTIRACFHCRHSYIDDDARMCCESLDVKFAATDKSITVVEARGKFGPCGFDARFLDIIGDKNHAARSHP